MTTTYNVDLDNDLDRLTAFVSGLSCCCQPLMRCSRCQALYGGMRREVTNDAAVLGIIGPPEQDPDEAATNLLALELARLKRELAELTVARDGYFAAFRGMVDIATDFDWTAEHKARYDTIRAQIHTITMRADHGEREK